jgi:hypothetical protein
MREPIRVCCDCVHFLGEGDESKCARTHVHIPDLIYGKHRDHYSSCAGERSGRCGKDGKYWELRK